MVHYRYQSGHRMRRKNRNSLFLTAALVAISMSPVAFYANLQIPNAQSTDEPSSHLAISLQDHDAEISEHIRALVEPKLTLKAEALSFASNAPLTTAFTPRIVNTALPARQASIEQVQPAGEMTVAQAVQPIPLPVPRPAEFKFVKAPEGSQAETKAVRAPTTPIQTASAAAQAAPANDPSFIEKLFGIKPRTPPEAAMSYAAIDSRSMTPSSRIDSLPNAGDRTAVYDISAKVVIMPNGERLEAHSGLGDKLDDPRFVHVRMRGATPPGTYVLTEREALFHGVRALRMNPVGGTAAIYGRDGILAHTYMLGPNGDSNGCISFRNYDRFLQAYLKGEVNRIVVVAGSRQDLLPRMVNRGQRLTVPERDT